MISGLDVAEAVFLRLDPDARDHAARARGRVARGRARSCASRARARALLTAERTALNFLGRLSGVATKTARGSCARSAPAARGSSTRARPRPGCGRSRSARSRTAAASTTASGCSTSSSSRRTTPRWPAGWGRRCGGRGPRGPDLPLAVEVRDEREIAEALAAGAPRLLLDNMTPERGPRRGGPGRPAARELEVSGGVDEETVLVYATITGVDYVSIGALTHSAPVLDLSLILETRPVNLLHPRVRASPCRRRYARSPPSAAP